MWHFIWVYNVSGPQRVKITLIKKNILISKLRKKSPFQTWNLKFAFLIILEYKSGTVTLAKALGLSGVW